jgi:hypothetical protein
MKLVFSIFFAIAFSASAHAQIQKVDYALTGKVDSFFLDEIVTAIDSTGKHVSISKSSQLFRSEDQLVSYIKYLRNQGAVAKQQEQQVLAEAKAKAKKILEEADAQAKNLRDYGPKVILAADKIEAALGKDTAVFNKQTQPVKPKPKKKKKA